MFARSPAPVSAVEPQRPRLELSGPRLALALETLVVGCEGVGGVERYVDALKLKTRLFGDALNTGEPGTDALKALLALLPTVRRRVGPYLAPDRVETLREAVASLLWRREDTSTADARVAAFCGAFPDGRDHRWVRDLAVEILHNVDPERYPLMCRWVWDARANTGVLREIWHAENIDHVTIEVPDTYATFVVLREELAQYLSENGVFRDVMHYVDLLTAQVYAGYISEQGGQYLRTDFSSPQDPMLYTQRLLGLDAVDAKGRTRLKAADGEAVPADPQRLT